MPSASLGEVQFRQMLIEKLKEILPKTKFEIFHSSNARYYNVKQKEWKTREFDIIISKTNAVKLIEDKYIVPVDGRVYAVIEAKKPTITKLGITQAKDGQECFNSRFAFATNFKSLYDSSKAEGITNYSETDIVNNIELISRQISETLKIIFERKEPELINEENVLNILDEAILIIFNELKAMDPETLNKTTGLLFATNLDYKTYSEEKKREKLLHDTRKSAAYILLDQLIFYNILSSEIPGMYPPLFPITGTTLRPINDRFEKVLAKDYNALFFSNIVKMRARTTSQRLVACSANSC